MLDILTCRYQFAIRFLADYCLHFGSLLNLFHSVDMNIPVDPNELDTTLAELVEHGKDYALSHG